SKEVQGCVRLTRKTTRCGLKNLNLHLPAVGAANSIFFLTPTVLVFRLTDRCQSQHEWMISKCLILPDMSDLIINVVTGQALPINQAF
ncbi:MAG: hypothetical protein PHE03_09850, partial [Bacteroidales bacterium]|nr:hypothetical protein [Bacteroidales bacterium]